VEDITPKKIVIFMACAVLVMLAIMFVPLAIESLG
jgi:hypothetical protein